MLQMETSGGLQNVQTGQGLSRLLGEGARTLESCPNSVPPKPRSSSLRFLVAGVSSESEAIDPSTSLSSRRSSTSLASTPREATVAELSSSSCPWWNNL